MDSISRANGGIFEAERRLQQSLQAQPGIEVEVVGLRDAATESDWEAWSPLHPRVCSIRGPQSFGYAPGLLDALIEARADLAYFVGLWKYPSVAALRWVHRTRKPFMVAPHGMLDPWALRNSGAKKRIAAVLFQNAQFRKASCIRALCAAEAASIRAYGVKKPICVIPNGIDLPTIEPPRPELGEGPSFPADRKVLLYLGRLHPKKGLPNLIEAWSRVESAHGKKWMLAVAGWNQGGHEEELKRQATGLGIRWGESRAPAGNSLLFLGPQFGQAKAMLYSRCEAFILPSFSEGLPMVILEAWAYGKPVLMTPECNLPEGFAARAALRIDTTSDGIAQGLNQFFEMSADEQHAMGGLGLTLVKDRFAWSGIAAEMRSVYQWMIGEGMKPKCVCD